MRRAAFDAGGKEAVTSQPPAAQVPQQGQQVTNQAIQNVAMLVTLAATDPAIERRRKASVEAGIPLMWQMQQEGYTEQELAELEDAKQEESNGQQQSLATALTNAQRNFDQNGNGNGTQGIPAMNGNGNGVNA